MGRPKNIVAKVGCAVCFEEGCAVCFEYKAVLAILVALLF